MKDLALNPEPIPDEAEASLLYRLTLRPKPGSDAIRNLRAALKILSRRHGLDCVELKPVVESKPRQTRPAVAERQARHKVTSPHYSFFGESIPRPPEGWPKSG